MSESPVVKPVGTVSVEPAQKAPYFSLRGMLQKTLYDAAIYYLERTRSDLSSVTRSPSNLPHGSDALSVDWVPIKLHRQVSPVSYCSAIARKLRGIDQQPLQQIVEGLQQILLKRPSDSSQISHLDDTKATQITRFTVQIQEHSQIALVLTESALLDWVQSFLQAPWGISGRFSEPLKPEDCIGVSPLSRRLALSPIALLQYHHADCCTYVASPCTTSLTPELCHRAMFKEQPPLNRPRQQVLWSLINLADALEDPSVPTRLQMQAGLILAEALYQWSAQGRTEPASDLLLAQAAQRLLRHLLEDHLGCNAPLSL